jgi:adenine deaminase
MCGSSTGQAIRIATLNDAIFLGRQDRIGSIAVGKNADLVVMKGDPSSRIADIENVEIVFITGYQARAAAAEMFVYLGIVSVLRPTDRGKATSRRASQIDRLENRFT